MAKPQIGQFLKRQDRLVWARFLNSPEGVKGLTYLRVGFPNKKAENEADLIRNGVRCEVWQEVIEAIEEIGEVPEKAESADAHEPLEK